MDQKDNPDLNKQANPSTEKENPFTDAEATSAKDAKKRDYKYLYIGFAVLVLLIMSAIFIIIPSLQY